jgi:predicted TIM-barrel fold metal-dependent hydrolase
MDQNHISHMVRMPQPQVNRQKRNGEIIPPAPIEEWINEARKYPDRFVVLGGGGSLNSIIHDRSPDGNPGGSLKKTFVERAEELVRMGVVGFGELSVMHLALVDNHAFEDVPADHPLFLMLADISAKHEMIIDIHFDPVLKDMPRPNYLPNGNPPILKRNIEAFDRLLAHNRKARFSWAHAGSDNLGFWTAQFSKEMLRKHPNLYMSLRMTKGRAPQNHPLTMNGIKDEWMEVFKAFPDRFFLGGDQFILGDGARGAAVKFSKIADPVRKRSRRFLSFLPENLARKIGYENAVREYKIADTSRLVKR